MSDETASTAIEGNSQDTPAVGACPCSFPDTFQLGCVFELAKLVKDGKYRSKEARHHAGCIIGTFDFLDAPDDGGIFGRASGSVLSAEELAHQILDNFDAEGRPVASGLGSSILAGFVLRLLQRLLERWLNG